MRIPRGPLLRFASYKRRRRRRCKSEVTIPKRASATAASLQGRLRATIEGEGGGEKASNTGARERNLSRRVLRDAQTTNDALWSSRMQPPRVDSMMRKGSEY
jgi:hypothetical protein